MPKLTLSFKGRLIDVFHLQEGETVIGRDSNCDITIDSLAIAPAQVSIMLEDEICHLKALDDVFPVFINHNLQDEADLQHGDAIQVGKHTLTFAEDAIDLGGELKQTSILPEAVDEARKDADEKESELNSKGMLQIMNGENFGRIIPLTRNMTRVGRVGGDCAIIARRDSGYYISYLEGPNTPVVNKHPIGDESQILNDGDIIEVGSTQMQFHT